MGKYSFVLSDALYKQYYLFKTHQDYDKEIISHLLKFYTGDFSINISPCLFINTDFFPYIRVTFEHVSNNF